MMIYSHFALPGFTNTYLIGGDNGGDAILVDPGVMDTPLLRIIEENNYYVRSILVTHGHDNHIHGIQTLLKIYNADIYSSNPRLYTFQCNQVNHNQKLDLHGIEVLCHALPGHSSDSMIYSIENMLFTGDTLLAGRLGQATNSYGQVNLYERVRTQLLTMPPSTLLFPGHGPPSTLQAEIDFNRDIREDQKPTV